MSLVILKNGIPVSKECLSRQHTLYPDSLSGCLCGCYHSGKYAPVGVANSNKGLNRNIQMSTNNKVTKKNIQEAEQRLKIMYDEISTNVFSGNASFTIVGKTVVPILFGTEPDEYIIRISEDLTNLTEFLLESYLSGFSDYNKESENVYTFSVETVFGRKYIRTEHLDTMVFWDLFHCFYSDEKIYNPPTETSSIKLINKTYIKDPKAVLQQGVDIASKFGLNIDLESINYLADLIKYAEPPEKVNETLIGFRAYKIINGYLQGQHNVVWRNETLTVDCPEFVRHIKETDVDWRMASVTGQKSGHECGIYIHKDPATCLYEVNGIQAMAMVYAYGVIGDFEKGYRAEHCKIVKLWVFENTASGKPVTPYLAQAYNVEKGIIVGATYSDFLYDKEVAQWAGR